MAESGISHLNPLQLARQELKRLVRKGLHLDIEPGQDVPYRRFEEFKKDGALYLAYTVGDALGGYEAARLDLQSPTVFHVVSVDVEMGGLEEVLRGPFAVPEGMQSEDQFRRLAEGEGLVEVLRFDCERQARFSREAGPDAAENEARREVTDFKAKQSRPAKHKFPPVGFVKAEATPERLVFAARVGKDRLSQYEIPLGTDSPTVIRRKFHYGAADIYDASREPPLAADDSALVKAEEFAVLAETRDRFEELLEHIVAHTVDEQRLEEDVLADLRPLIATSADADCDKLFEKEGDSIFKIGKTRYIAANSRTVLRISDSEGDQTYHVSLQASSPRGFRELIQMALDDLAEKLSLAARLERQREEPLVMAFRQDAFDPVCWGGVDGAMSASPKGEVFYLKNGIAYVPLAGKHVARVVHEGAGAGERSLFTPAEPELATPAGFKRMAEELLDLIGDEVKKGYDESH